MLFLWGYFSSSGRPRVYWQLDEKCAASMASPDTAQYIIIICRWWSLKVDYGEHVGRFCVFH